MPFTSEGFSSYGKLYNPGVVLWSNKNINTNELLVKCIIGWQKSGKWEKGEREREIGNGMG